MMFAIVKLNVMQVLRTSKPSLRSRGNAFSLSTNMAPGSNTSRFSFNLNRVQDKSHSRVIQQILFMK